MKFSQRILDMPVSAMRKLSPYSQKAKAEGVKVYHLNIGDPDLKTPEAMINKLHTWDINPIRYCNSQGDDSLINALCEYYKRLGAAWVKPENLLVTIGASEAMWMLYFTLCEAGDEVIIFEPFYSNYLAAAHLFDVKLVPVSTTIENGFHLPPKSEIEKLITNKTKAIMYTSPNNPTGTIFSRTEIETLIDIAKEHDLYLIADEVYREFNFSGEKSTSLLEFMPDLPDRLIVVDSLSKRYSLCGARIGNFVTKNTDFIQENLKIGLNRLSAGLIDQVVGSALTEVPKSYTDNLQKEYKARRDLVCELLSEIPGITVSVPEGAFYVMAGLPIDDSEKFCKWLLEEFRDNNETVMFAFGSGFYATPGKGNKEVRIAYVLNQTDLKRSMEILKLALEKYNLR